MLVPSTNARGEPVYLRQPFRADDYVPRGPGYDGIRTMQGWSVRELMAMRDGPFESLYFIDKVDRDGKTWWRVCHVTDEWCLLIEDTDQPMSWGEMKPLPPEEARDLSRTYDPRRDRPVVDAP